jgi:hypothetical protein
LASFAELLIKSQKTQAWVSELTGEKRQLVNSWFKGRTKVPLRHKEVLEPYGLWPTLDADQFVAIGMTAETVQGAWLILGGATRDTGVDIWMVDQQAYGLLLGTIAEELARGASFEEGKERLAARARTMVAALQGRAR